MTGAQYSFLADSLLVIHFLFVGFVVIGFAAILAGRLRHWHWVHNRRFRISHLVAIGVVVLQAWLGRLCPLTIWEHELRRRAGEAGYDGSFIQHWLHRVLYFEAESWVFTAVYTTFGLIVLIIWYIDRRQHQDN